MTTEQESTGARELDAGLRDTAWVSTQEFESDIRRRRAAMLIALIPLVMLLGYGGTVLNQALNKPTVPLTPAEEIGVMEFLNEHWNLEESKKTSDDLLSVKMSVEWQIELLKKYGGSPTDLARWEGYLRELQAEREKIYAEMPWLRPY